MAKTFKERMLDRLPGSRIASDETRPRKDDETFLQKASGFFQEFKTEMKKVTWPGRKETAASTVVVIFTVLIIVLFLGLVDYALGRIVYTILN